MRGTSSIVFEVLEYPDTNKQSPRKAQAEFIAVSIKIFEFSKTTIKRCFIFYFSKNVFNYFAKVIINLTFGTTEIKYSR